MQIKKHVISALEATEKGITKAKDWVNKKDDQELVIQELKNYLEEITKAKSLDEAITLAKEGLTK